MTPQDVCLYSRQMYNSVGDSFFPDAELYRHLWAAQMKLALETKCIRRVYTTSTVADQQEYTKPTNTVSIKRITYNGQKLMPISQREDDSLTLNNATTTATGTPQYYFEWGTSFFLRPVPAEVGTLKIFSFNQPQEVTSSSSLEVPDRYHQDLALYLVAMMAAKDKNPGVFSLYEKMWLRAVDNARKQERVLLRGDAFAAVQDVELLPVTVIGAM